ncbi:MAG: HD domain-containing protein [Alphaproteobacteria bacterium]|nr:HD domain-containing protein [Alphaproteobacteria bacterium]
MNTVSFTRMRDGTQADYDLLHHLEQEFCNGLTDRVLAHLKMLDDSLGGYQISRFEHSLQSATRAEADGADIDWIVTALLHDMGDTLAPMNHDSMAAAILAPYVREECTWVLKHHGIFQLKYYGAKIGADPESRAKFIDDPNYDSCVTFCERWDENCFDPSYKNAPLSHFEPMVREVFARKPWDPAVLQSGVQVPLVADSAKLAASA